MTKTLKDLRIQVMMSQPELARLDEWRFAAHIASRGEAIRRLVVAGMEPRSISDTPSSLVPEPVHQVAPPKAVATTAQLPDELMAQVAAYEARTPFLGSVEEAIVDLIERGLEALDPPETVVTFSQSDIDAAREFASGRPVADVIREMVDLALRNYRSIQEEKDD